MFVQPAFNYWSRSQKNLKRRHYVFFVSSLWWDKTMFKNTVLNFKFIQNYMKKKRLARDGSAKYCDLPAKKKYCKKYCVAKLTHKPLFFWFINWNTQECHSGSAVHTIVNNWEQKSMRSKFTNKKYRVWIGCHFHFFW